ncbi:MAG: hypothetical protein WD876_00835 [Candidatus Pacearchaeota archaeon]
MLKRNMSRGEIEKELLDKGDFVQIDHLTAFLKQDIPTDIRKFVMIRIAELYEKKFMFREAAKLFNNVAMLVIPFKDKIQHHVKEAELYIKAGDLREADHAMQRALAQANQFEKNDIMFSIKKFYKVQAEAYEKGMRRNNATKMYEKLLELSPTSAEREEYKRKILPLYEKLGKFREFNALKGMKN